MKINLIENKIGKINNQKFEKNLNCEDYKSEEIELNILHNLF